MSASERFGNLSKCVVISVTMVMGPLPGIGFSFTVHSKDAVEKNSTWRRCKYHPHHHRQSGQQSRSDMVDHWPDVE